MGALDECHYNVELENGINVGECVELGFEGEPETLAIEDAVGVLLQGLGEDINREGLRKTPLRVAKALREGTRGYKQKVNDIVSGALFPEAGLESKFGHAGGAGGLVIVRDLDHFSYCESCLLPFQVKCHVGYVPSAQRVVGLSKLSRVAEVFAKRLQDPQRLADEVCSALQQGIKPTGVAVVLQCSHIHFPDFESAIFDPNHQGWSSQIQGINVDDACGRGSVNKSWCPSQTFRKMGASDSAMVSAVSSILSSLGEDPSRKELAETPARFVKVFLNFKNTNLDMKLNGFVRSKRDSLTPTGTSAERLTRQIAETVSTFLGEDVMVVVEASHTCMISRGIEKFGSSTATVAVLGRFSTDPTARAKFLQIIPNSS
ncbi:UNVERIFIED_CONTAM: GTP cyclohydrolase 1 [Sesamum latifolium]|uniref:GTP cyclohydrolase 1 n=1 Tax=Sesamum latifolium TaxID=2727402 RepID=A0AAW2Y2S5_9LAMI